MSYYKPTPIKWRKAGDTILLGATAMSGFIMGTPLTETGKLWLIFTLNVIGVIGKMLTNFFKADEEKMGDAIETKEEITEKHT